MDRHATLLLVEDEPLLRRLVAQFLRGSSFQVVEAVDGPDGVAQYCDHGPFDLILLDLNLPGFSGVEVCHRILRMNPEQRVLICSAAIVPEAEERLRALGVESFLTKPYQPEVLLERIAAEMNPEPASIPMFATGMTSRR